MAVERRRLRATGAVQGVGLRPWSLRAARRLGLAGWVRNAGPDLELALEGLRGAIDAFVAELRARPPAGARVDGLVEADEAPCGDGGFRVEPSAAEPVAGAPRIPLDRALCAACRREMFDPTSRRHRHAFPHCAECGPRAAVLAALPWDRAHTALAGFAPCARCRHEHTDPADRRFHAETIACPDCGPALRARVPGGPALAGDPVERAAGALRAGAAVAVLGGGGYHLAVRADDASAVARLRKRKRRARKPFALLVPDLAGARRLARLSPADEALLAGPCAPVLIAPRRAEGCAALGLADGVAPGLCDLGLLLPFTPVQWLLLYAPGSAPGRDPARFAALVWTSANASGEPTLFDPGADEALAGVADLLLDHDRRVLRPNDDPVFRSAAGGPIPIRLSRSSAPLALALPGGVRAAEPLLAAGGDLKAAPALALGGTVWLAEHVGDLGSAAASDAWRARVADLCRLAGVRPALAAHDLHPEAFGRALAAELAPRTLAVQHHHAHAAACLVEHGRSGPALALVLDGFGHGADGGAWGGELLCADLWRAERLAHLEPAALPGGDAAAREPWRMAAAWLERAGAAAPEAWRARRDPERLAAVRALARRAPNATTSCGRLFDAVGSLLGCGDEADYEGEVAMRLEALASEAPETPPSAPRLAAAPVVPVAALVREIAEGCAAGAAPARLARRFHDALADRLADAAAAHARARDLACVVLSGGCFQNRLLGERVARRLAARGLEVLCHRRLPPGDGGLAVGQAAVAAARNGEGD
jgi:hydrogenase maturation protein HypF